MRLPLRVTGDPWLYTFARIVLAGAVRAYGRVRFSGTDNLPASGPAILVANHPSDVDPILLAIALPRTVHFMGDVVQFQRAFVGPIIARLGAFPVHKGSPDRRGVETALELLRRGEVIALFPEGDLYRRADPEPFGRGVGFLAARSGAPVIPVGIAGAERIWDGRRLGWPWIAVRVGAPLRFDGEPRRGHDAHVRMAAEVRAAVVALLDGGPLR